MSYPPVAYATTTGDRPDGPPWWWRKLRVGRTSFSSILMSYPPVASAGATAGRPHRRPTGRPMELEATKLQVTMDIRLEGNDVHPPVAYATTTADRPVEATWAKLQVGMDIRLEENDVLPTRSLRHTTADRPAEATWRKLRVGWAYVPRKHMSYPIVA